MDPITVVVALSAVAMSVGGAVEALRRRHKEEAVQAEQTVKDEALVARAV